MVTIIMPLKGRDDYTKRWLKYYDYLNTEIPVVAADGSKVSQGSMFSNYKNIKHIYYGHDTTRQIFMLKLFKASAEVKTPFSVLLDNDDFYSVNGLTKSASFLCKNSDFSSARGAISSHAISNRNMIFKGLSGNLKDVSGKFPIDRINGMFTNYFGGWHDLTYTQFLNAIFNIMVCLDLEFFLGDIFDFVLSSLGNVHRGKYPYLIHQTNSPKVRSRPGTAIDWMRLPEWNEEFQTVLTLQAKIIASVSDYTLNESFNICKKNYTKSLAKHLKIIGKNINDAQLKNDDKIDKAHHIFLNIKKSNVSCGLSHRNETLDNFISHVKAFL